MSNLMTLLQTLVKEKGSDLHLASNSVPFVRVRGEMLKLDMPPFNPKVLEEMLSSIITASNKQDLSENRQLDFSIKVNNLGIFRVNYFYQKHGISAVFRSLPSSAPTIEMLNLPPICKMACSFPNGLVIVTGPTGSGKSTTLAAMIDHINRNEKGHIITLEDPIEFQHESQKGLMNQRELGKHFTSFKEALKAALREDPDCILVGEMRDQETIQLAITAAETGHLVFATLHTNSAPKSLDRIIDSFEGGAQAQIRSMLSESLRVIISQKLVPTKDGKSRMAFHDILVNNSAVANLIREEKTYQIGSIMQTAKREGMQILDQALLEAVKAGVIDGAVAWEAANDKTLFAQWTPKEVQNLATNVSYVGKTGLDTALLHKKPTG
jgi:twitching motility protein PilT